MAAEEMILKCEIQEYRAAGMKGSGLVISTQAEGQAETVGIPRGQQSLGRCWGEGDVARKGRVRIL